MTASQGSFPPSQVLYGKKTPTRAISTKILANYVSEDSLITAVCDKNITSATFPLGKCQEPIRREMTEGSSTKFIGYQMTKHSKMAAQSHPQGFN